MPKKQMEAIICYAHSDRDILDQLHEHLATLQRQDLLNTWCDREILPGGVIDEIIESKLETVDVYLLLVSSAFIHSRYCFELEFATALKRWKAGEAIIVPIIVRECDWGIPELKQFKALPEDGRPVISRHWHTTDEAFKDVATGLRRLIENSGIPPATPTTKARRSRSKFVPDERHVTEDQRASLRKLGNEIVERLTAKAASAPDDELRQKQGKFFGIVWSQFNEHFGTTEHGLASLLREQFDDAKNWLLQYRASKDRNLKQTNPQKYRNTLTKTIHTIAGTLGWSKEQLHVFASEKLNYPHPISSLTDLGNRQLELVRDRIRYESTKRTATAGQARARRQPTFRRPTSMAAAEFLHSILESPFEDQRGVTEVLGDGPNGPLETCIIFNTSGAGKAYTVKKSILGPAISELIRLGWLLQPESNERIRVYELNPRAVKTKIV